MLLSDTNEIGTTVSSVSSVSSAWVSVASKKTGDAVLTWSVAKNTFAMDTGRFAYTAGAKRGGHWGVLETPRPKKKSYKTVKKPIQWWQVRHTEQTTLTLYFIKVFVNVMDLSKAFISFSIC